MVLEKVVWGGGKANGGEWVEDKGWVKGIRSEVGSKERSVRHR